MPELNGPTPDPSLVFSCRVFTNGRVEFQWPGDEAHFWLVMEKLKQNGRAHYLQRNAPMIEMPGADRFAKGDA